MDATSEKDALARLDRLREGWLEAPQLMERARELLRDATRLAESMCKGKEKREAAEAIARAVEGTQAAIAERRAVDGLRTLRRIGERVALSAAKAARSRAAGQTSLTAGAKERPKTPAAAKPKRERKPAAPRSPVPAAAPAEAAADPERDKALLDAFSAAIAAAMKNVA